MPSHRSIVIFSGGTAANHLVDVFESIRKSKECPLTYIIPISDNGGSSSELIRVFGGPGIGDVRSRLVRLIPRLPQGSPGYREREAIRGLFNHRLSSVDARMAKLQWTEVVDGTSGLWKDISSAKKELVRSLFNVVNSEITKRSRPPTNTFDFTSASVGNLFLTGARLFSGSFESAIYLLGSICGVEDEFVKVIPSINSNFSHHIAAGLEDGTVIVGQNAISHPSPTTVMASPEKLRLGNGTSAISYDDPPRRHSESDHYYGDEYDALDEHFGQDEEDANLPGTLPTLRTRNIMFNKDAHLNEELPARISRLWYINPYGQEILPPGNPRAVQALATAQAVIYSIGSLYTSLVPSLILRGMGDALHHNTYATSTSVRTKILILNGSLDREVGPQPPHTGAGERVFSAIDFVEAIVRAGEQSRGVVWEPDLEVSADAGLVSQSKKRPPLLSSKSEGVLSVKSLHHPEKQQQQQQQQLNQLFPPPLPASAFPSRTPSREPSPTSSLPDTPTTDSIAPRPGHIADALSSLGSSSFHSASPSSRPSTPFISSQQPKSKPTKPNKIYNRYVTHLIHLPNSKSTPHVDRDQLLTKYGIQCIKVYGRSVPNGEGMRYDPAALRGAIEALLGRRAEREPPIRHNSKKGAGVVAGDDSSSRETEHHGFGVAGAGGRERSATIAAAVAVTDFSLVSTSSTAATITTKEGEPDSNSDSNDTSDSDKSQDSKIGTTTAAIMMPRRNTVE